MVGPVPVSISQASVSDISIVNPQHWRAKGALLEGEGYYCPKCGSAQVVNKVVLAEF